MIIYDNQTLKKQKEAVQQFYLYSGGDFMQKKTKC